MIKTKKGMASLYLVAFTTLLLGVLTMSFVRVMVTESKESSNSDLSQSAYDSALAGIEDAKTAIIMYNACLGDSSRSFGGLSCTTIKQRMEKMGFEEGSCDIVSAILNRSGGSYVGEVEIKDNESQPNELSQAYTCVTIANDFADYRSLLNESVSARTIPIRVTNDDFDDIVAFELQWYSTEMDDSHAGGPVGFMQNSSEVVYTGLNTSDIIPFAGRSVATDSLPIVSFELFQTDKDGFRMHELDLNNETNTGTDHASIVLYPDNKIENGENGTFIGASELLTSSNKDSQVALRKGNSSITPKLVSCQYNSGFRCRATIELPATYKNNTVKYTKNTRAEETFMIRVGLPYSTPRTDFSVRACKNVKNNHCDDYAVWTGSQFVVDSTGRASTLYRRVTARIDVVNTSFIYPNYAAQVTGDDATIEKNLWVTENCWASDGDGNSSACANNGVTK